MAGRIVILSPLDLKPGATSPKGQVVEKSTMYVNDGSGVAMVDVTYTDGTSDAFMWPLGDGWS